MPVKFTAKVPSLSVMFRVADFGPNAVGVKVTVKLQLEPAASVDPQVVVTLKSPVFVPTMFVVKELSVFAVERFCSVVLFVFEL